MRILPDAYSYLFDIEPRRYIELVGHIFAVLFSLFDALGEKVFYLTVQRAKVIFGPYGYGVVKFR